MHMTGIKGFIVHFVSHTGYFLVDLINFTKIVVMVLLFMLWKIINWALLTWSDPNASDIPTSWYYIIVVIGAILATMLGGYVYMNKMDKAVTAVAKLWKETCQDPSHQSQRTDKLVKDTEEALSQSFTTAAKAEVSKTSVTSI